MSKLQTPSAAAERDRLAIGVALLLFAERSSWATAVYKIIASERALSVFDTAFYLVQAAMLFGARRAVMWRMSESTLRHEHARIVEELLGCSRGQRFGYEIVERALVARIELAKSLPLALGESVVALVFGIAMRSSPGFAYFMGGYAVLALLVFVFRSRIHAWSIAQSEFYFPILERIEWVTRAQEEIVANGSVPWVRTRFAADIDRWRRETFRVDAILLVVSRWPLAVFGGALALSVLFFDIRRGSTDWVYSAASLAAAASAISLWLQVARARGRIHLPSWSPREGSKMDTLSGRSIQFADVTFAFPNAEPVLRSLSFEASPGMLTVLVGENGAGKSTVLRLAEELLLPTTGTVNNNVEAESAVAYFPQRSELLDGASPEASWKLLGDQEENAKPLFAHPTGQPIAPMSGGERKKYLLNRLFASPGKTVYLLDEPDAALDDASVDLLVRVLHERKENAVVLISSHHPRMISAADRVIDLSRAASKASDTKTHLRSAV